MMRVLLGPLIGAFLLSACAQVPVETKACYSPEWEWGRHIGDTLARLDGAQFVELSSEQIARFNKEWNAAGEPSGYLWERVGWFYISEIPVGRVVFGMGDCAWFSTMMPAGFMNQFVGKGV